MSSIPPSLRSGGIAAYLLNLALFFVNKFLFQVNKIICEERCGAIDVKLFRNVLKKSPIFRIEDNNSNFVLQHNQLEIMR